MENEFFDLKLWLRGHGVFDNYKEMKSESEFNGSYRIMEYFVKLIIKSDEIHVEAARSSLVETSKVKQIKSNRILTKNELKQALGLHSKQEKAITNPYVFTSPEARFEFATRKEAMDRMNLSSTAIMNAFKNGKIVIEDVEYKFDRK